MVGTFTGAENLNRFLFTRADLCVILFGLALTDELLRLLSDLGDTLSRRDSVTAPEIRFELSDYLGLSSRETVEECPVSVLITGYSQDERGSELIVPVGWIFTEERTNDRREIHITDY